MVIVVASQKGGSGKSTLVTGLAALWSRDRMVRIIDADAHQYTASRWSGTRRNAGKPGIFTTIIRQPSLHRERWDPTDLVLIDCPGRLDDCLRSALLAADALLVPLQPTYPDAWALPGLAEQLGEAQKHRARPLVAHVALCRLKVGTSLARRAEDLAQQLPPGFRLLRSRIRDLVDFQLALGVGLGPTEYRPRGKAAADLQALASEFLGVAHG